MKRSGIIFIAVIMFCFLGALSARGGEDLKDTPYFSGMPSHEIIEADDKEFDEFGFCDGKKVVTVEGKKWWKFYNLKDGAKQPSDLQITRNYAAAVKSMGGTVLYEGKDWSCGDMQYCGRIMTGRVVKGDKELWVEVSPCNGGFDYKLTVVEKEGMKQEVTASDMLDKLNKEGSIALYINFDTGKSMIKAESRPIIDQIVSMMKGNPGLKISVEGHTDNAGNSKSNKALSEDRAKSVVSALVKAGIDSKRLSAAGFGQDKPIADNGSEEGRAKNRRVELVKK